MVLAGTIQAAPARDSYREGRGGLRERDQQGMRGESVIIPGNISQHSSLSLLYVVCFLSVFRFHFLPAICPYEGSSFELGIPAGGHIL